MKKIRLGMFIAFMSMIGSANSQLATGPQVGAMVEATCDINSQNISFGQLDFINNLGSFRVSSIANVRCTLGTGYKMKVETEADKKRFMKSEQTDDVVAYHFYKSGTMVKLGSDENDDYIEGVGNGLYQRINFDVEVLPNQNVKPGIYVDIATIYITY